MSVKGDAAGPAIWSYVDQPRKTTGRVGRHTRPWSIRERLVTEAIGAEVRRLREAKGWPVSELAKRLCCSQVHVTYLENGRRAVWIALLWDLADVFDHPPRHFVDAADQAIARFEMAGRRAMRRGPR